jgi:hypothetical protein
VVHCHPGGDAQPPVPQQWPQLIMAAHCAFQVHYCFLDYTFLLLGQQSKCHLILR